MILNTTELQNRLLIEPAGPARSYLKLEYLIAYAIEFADALRTSGERPPVPVEHEALIEAASRLAQAVRLLNGHRR